MQFAPGEYACGTGFRLLTSSISIIEAAVRLFSVRKMLRKIGQGVPNVRNIQAATI